MFSSVFSFGRLRYWITALPNRRNDKQAPITDRVTAPPHISSNNRCHPNQGKTVVTRKELQIVAAIVRGIGRASAIIKGNDKNPSDHGAKGNKRAISTSFATR